MSFDPDNPEHENSIEDLLRQIILKLDVLILHNEVITSEKYTEEDIEE